MLHESQDKVFADSKIVQYLIETLLLQLMSLLFGPFAFAFAFLAFAFAFVVKIIRVLQQVRVLLVAMVAHPFLSIVHPVIVHQPCFVWTERTIEVLVINGLLFIQLCMIFLPDL